MNERFDIDSRQNATTERSASARLDRPTEDRLYALFRNFFLKAEEERRWNLWNDLPWGAITTAPSAALAEAVTRQYHDELFLPDFSAKILAVLRASRGRAWFWTRWSYEEGKHLLALAEWLLRSGTFTNDELRDQSDDLLAAYAWEPPYDDAITALADTLLWELRERDRYRALRRLAEAEGDLPLIELTTRIQRDEEAHRSFLRECLLVIGETYPDRVTEAVRSVVEMSSSGDEGTRYTDALIAELDLVSVLADGSAR